jgi:hypothetical protein
MRALSLRRFDANLFSAYERSFWAYFDPSMIFLDLCAATMRNRHFTEPWLKALARGYAAAQKGPTFARIAGPYFGGLEISPAIILSQVSLNIASELAFVLPKSIEAFFNKDANPLFPSIREMMSWHSSWCSSIFDDPVWHARWTLDLQRKWVKFLSSTKGSPIDPRADGPFGKN